MFIILACSLILLPSSPRPPQPSFITIAHHLSLFCSLGLTLSLSSSLSSPIADNLFLYTFTPRRCLPASLSLSLASSFFYFRVPDISSFACHLRILPLLALHRLCCDGWRGARHPGPRWAAGGRPRDAGGRIRGRRLGRGGDRWLGVSRGRAGRRQGGRGRG